MVKGPDCGLTPGQTGRLLVGSKITFNLTTTVSYLLNRAPEASYWESYRQYRSGQEETVQDGERTVSRCGCRAGTVREPRKGNIRH
jgi:hypothetical protein